MPLRATLWFLMSQAKHSWAEPWVKVPLCKPNDFRQLHIHWREKKKLKKTKNECYSELVVDATSIMTDLLHFNLLSRAEKGYIHSILVYCTMYIHIMTTTWSYFLAFSLCLPNKLCLLCVVPKSSKQSFSSALESMSWNYSPIETVPESIFYCPRKYVMKLFLLLQFGTASRLSFILFPVSQ